MLSRLIPSISRHSSSAAATAQSATRSISKLPNGLTVATVEQNGAASQLVLAFRAGSRYENQSNRGAVHALRNCIGNDSSDYFGVSLVWNAAAQGGEVSAVSTRDIFAVRLGVSRNGTTVSSSLLGELANPVCKPWEVEEILPSVPADSTYRCKFSAAIDALHQAAFRNGSLGNSVYAGPALPAFKQIQSFKNNLFRSGNAVVVGINVDHDLLVDAASGFRLGEGGASEPSASKYFGGEVRTEAAGSSTIVAIGGEGSSLKNIAELAAQNVAAEFLVQLAEKSGASGAGSVNASYVDAGLVGVIISAPNGQIGELTKKVVNSIKSAKSDDSAIQTAKAKAALDILTAGEVSANVALDQATQILANGEAVAPSEFASAIENVSGADVQKVLSKIASKLSVSVYGSTRDVPYLDEL